MAVVSPSSDMCFTLKVKLKNRFLFFFRSKKNIKGKPTIFVESYRTLIV